MKTRSNQTTLGHAAVQCRERYMNRYIDWLRLPSEDEAIKNYQETYDKSFEEQRTNRQ